MGRNEFFAWLDQLTLEKDGVTADNPDRWDGVDQDEWWQAAREKRQRIKDQTK